MFLYSLLAVSDQATEIVKYISIGAVLLLLGVIALLCKKTHYDTKRIAFAGICVALSFTLSLIKFKPIQYGGSITLASLVPILIYAYAYGVKDGIIVGIIHGLLNFIESPYILTPATFVLDYLLPFTGVAVMGLFGNRKEKHNSFTPILLGSISAFALRFTCHLLSGIIFFLHGDVWVNFPNWAVSNAFIYSFIYQCVYIPADCLIACGVLYALYKTGVFQKLRKILTVKK